MTSPGRAKESALRTVVAGVCLVSSLVVLPAGFVLMIRALEGGGYGTDSMSAPFWWLGTGGGLLGMGIALLIWELSVRHGIRH